MDTICDLTTHTRGAVAQPHIWRTDILLSPGFEHMTFHNVLPGVTTSSLFAGHHLPRITSNFLSLSGKETLLKKIQIQRKGDGKSN